MNQLIPVDMAFRFLSPCALLDVPLAHEHADTQPCY
jgi:hypothetical protein